MIILVACEFSGRVRDAFIAKGHDAISCDLLPSESPGPHYQGDVRDILYSEKWDMLIAFPPCTYLTTNGNSWFNYTGNKSAFGVIERVYTRYILRVLAIEFFLEFINHPCQRICVENPLGIISKVYRKPNQYFCHTDHGSHYPKRTGLWLKGLPPLMATKKMIGIRKKGKDGREYSPLISDKGKRQRVLIPWGVAQAMADQWG